MKRIAITALGAGLAAGFAAAALSPATAAAAPPAPAPAAAPTFSFADCPELPAGADKTKWKCEVMLGTGHLRIGNTELKLDKPMQITHAEGPGGALLFGKLRHDPVPVPGGLLGTPDRGPVLRATANLQYAGHLSFPQGPVMTELLHVKLKVNSLLAGRNCTIGDDADPIRLRAAIQGEREIVSKDPLVMKFAVADDALAVPTGKNCGPLVDHRFGLPSASGENSARFDVFFAVKTYDRLGR